MKLPVELRSPEKVLINIKNNDQKYFLWCHIRHISSIKIHPEIITLKDKKLVNDLNYDQIEFSVNKEDVSRIETKTTFVSSFLILMLSVYNSDQNIKIQWIYCL